MQASSTILRQFGRWTVECLPADGARLSLLSYGRQPLLTAPPQHFRPPSRDFGRYETRPVYGYDDCFPSVDPCRYPREGGFPIADHGELCWLPWNVTATDHQLHCQVQSRQLPIRFQRTMTFTAASLRWQFSVVNDTDIPLPFLHVMHPLMPPAALVDLNLPDFATAWDDVANSPIPQANPRNLAAGLLSLRSGQYRMLLLREIQPGRFSLHFRSGYTLNVVFPAEIFSTLAIWWSNGGYPNEHGVRRYEFAFEPLAGPATSLEHSAEQGRCQMALPRQTTTWSIDWQITGDER